MKKKMTVICMLTVAMTMAACSFGKPEELPLYATESSGVEISESETGAGLPEKEEVKATSAPALDPDEVMEHGRQVAGLSGGETEESTEAGSGPGNGGLQPTATPEPSFKPAESTEPTDAPTQTPAQTAEPTAKPTEKPTVEPTAKPTIQPTQAPVQTAAPTVAPTPAQTPAPTVVPANTPTPTPDNPCANGHSYGEPYMWREPTCTIPGDLCYVCTVCGAEKHVGGGYKEHDYEKTLRTPGSCTEPDVWRYQCKNCEHWYDETDYSQCENRHNWVTGSYEVFDEVTLEWVTVTRTFCSNCNKDKPE